MEFHADLRRNMPHVLLMLPSFSIAAQQPARVNPASAPQPTTAAEAPNRDTSYIDEQGTAHVTRVVPVPQDLSPQAQLALGHGGPDQGPPQSLDGRSER
jgi:hypothetical protein